MVKQVSKELAVKMYANMVTLQAMDATLYEAQRQGRISFYLTTTGEEATNIGSAAALTSDDVVLAQVRNLIWRTMSFSSFAVKPMNNYHLSYIMYIVNLLSVSWGASIGSQEFFCGEVSHFKNLQTSALETNVIMGKAGRCQSIMARTNTITSRCHHPSGKKSTHALLLSSFDFH